MLSSYDTAVLDAINDNADRQRLESASALTPGYDDEVPKTLFTTYSQQSNGVDAALVGSVASALGINVDADSTTLVNEVEAAEANIDEIRQGGVANIIEGSSSLGALLLGNRSEAGQFFQDVASSFPAADQGANGIIFGWQEGGILGGVAAGTAAAEAVPAIATLFAGNTIAAMAGEAALAAGPFAIPVGIAVGALVAIFGGDHDNPANMPDKYDTARYGQEIADLQGVAGANGESFTESAPLKDLFGGRTGIQAIEETLAEYGSAANAPAWLQPEFDQLSDLFGISSTGSGELSFGHAINNEQIVGVEGTDGQIYQYTDLANAMYGFADAYAASRSIEITVPQGT